MGKQQGVAISQGRNSSIELLKVIAIIFIILSHAAPNAIAGVDHYINLDLCTPNIQVIVLVFFKYLAQVGNVIFIVSSAYFLLDSKRTKYDKVIGMVLDTFVISVIFLSAFVLMGYDLSFSVIAKQLIPVTMNNNWFVCCYIIFYLIHPALNFVVKTMSKKSLLIINIVTIIFYGIVNLFIKDRYYYSPLIGFIVIYFIVAYMKNYMVDFMNCKSANIKMTVICGALLFVQIVGTNVLGLTTGIFVGNLAWGSIIINPLIIGLVLGVFNLAKMKHFSNNIINHISGVSLLIYIIHANTLIIDYAKMDFFGYVYSNFSYDYILLWVLVVSAVFFVGALALSILYKNTIQKFVNFISKKILDFIIKLFNPLVEKILKVS